MKKILVALMLVLAAGVNGQVHFVKTTDLNAIFKQARKENKLIFIDAYTDWCSWCKELDKHVFSTKAIGDTMNKYFIATKLEMEKDSIGVLLTRKYGTNAYPTAIVLDANGNLVSLIKGYSEAGEYAQRLSDAANPMKQIKAKGFSNSFAVKYPSFYMDAIPMKGVKHKMPDSATVNAYFNRQHDLSLEYNWVMMNRFYYLFSDSLYTRVLGHEALFRKTFGDEAFESLAESMIGMKISACTKRHDFACMEQHLLTLEKVTTNGKKNRPFYIERYYSTNSMWEELTSYIKTQLNDQAYASNYAHLNDQAWTIYEKSDNQAALEQAVVWMSTVVKEKPVYMYLDTYAALLYKTNHLTKAQQYAEQAIDVGKQKGEDVSSTEELLKKIKSK